MKHEVNTTEKALAYIIDCTLATVADMAMKRSRGKHEYKRQISIAQTAIDWSVLFGVDLSSTRGADVLKVGSVQSWADSFDILKSVGK